MKKLIKTCGSIRKKEKLMPVEVNIMKNTSVSEATNPYANYYGRLPRKLNPNSLFLFTEKFFFLEEILGYALGVEKCLRKTVDFASALLEINGKQYPAIRLKNFPDYQHLSSLQECLVRQGVKFVTNIHIEGELNARINKLFALQEIEPGIYFDNEEDNKGYFACNKKLNPEEFEKTITKIKNNNIKQLFDAQQGELLRKGKVIEVVRVYAEGIETTLLQYLKEQFDKFA